MQLLVRECHGGCWSAWRHEVAVGDSRGSAGVGRRRAITGRLCPRPLYAGCAVRQNARTATMCAWCETSLTDPFRNARKRQADARPDDGGLAPVERRHSRTGPTIRSTAGWPQSGTSWSFRVGRHPACACPIAVTPPAATKEAVDKRGCVLLRVRRRIRPASFRATAR